ncbi:hypothetical protein ACFE04_022925 [Oxalis oulophora]
MNFRLHEKINLNSPRPWPEAILLGFQHFLVMLGTIVLILTSMVTLIRGENKPEWRMFLSFVGPGFLVSLAYLDPGNKLCNVEYLWFVKYCLWVLAKASVIAIDIPEVIGTTFALNIIFKVSLWAGVFFTGFNTLLSIGLQRYGVRKLEILIVMLVFVMTGCFFGELTYVKPPAREVIKGMFVPKYSGHDATGDAISLLGALIIPHNPFSILLSYWLGEYLHMFMDACRYFLIGSAFALIVAFLINIAIISVTRTICHAENLSAENVDKCSDLTLNSASFLLKFHYVCHCATGFKSKLNNQRHLCRTNDYAGILGLKGEEMVTKFID